MPDFVTRVGIRPLPVPAHRRRRRERAPSVTRWRHTRRTLRRWGWGRQRERAVQRDCQERKLFAADRLRPRLRALRGRPRPGRRISQRRLDKPDQEQRRGSAAWSKKSLANCRSPATTAVSKRKSNFDLDTGGSYIGFGYPGAASTNNRKVQELTGTASYQFLKSADRGSGQINVQLSWVEREPLSQGIGLGLGGRVHVFRPGALQPAVARYRRRR